MSNITPFEELFPLVAGRGIDEATWSALQNSIYPGCADESIIMALDYCNARGLDPLLKPVHLVPMSVKNAKTGNYDWRDVVMPGIGLYRIQADRSNTYAGATEPEFGPTITSTFQDGNQSVEMTYPEWCKITVYKLVNGNPVGFSAKEMWLENYATAGKNTQKPNAMWSKRPYAQLAKCTEAQALRKAWPEIGQQVTMEEMEGKEFHVERDITPKQKSVEGPKLYSQKDFDKNFGSWKKKIESRSNTADRIISLIEAKGALSPEMKAQIKAVKIQAIEEGETHESN
jgi:phage recombination protein Bet